MPAGRQSTARARWRLFATAAIGSALLALAWAWAGRAQQVPAIGAGAARLQCVSYAPFLADQSPLRPFTVERARIESDLRLLAGYFDCVRIYSVAGLEEVPAVAAALGLQVIAGAWINADTAASRREFEALVALANRYPQVIRAVVVGNEVILRRERTAAQMVALLDEARGRVNQPVTYADVWDFWLLNPELAGAVDFLTIHLLPYWENDPSGIEAAIDAVRHARDTISRTFPGKPILIGETGWPSEGRQREDAVPGRANQARFLRGFVDAAAREGWDYNLIEAFDQNWKRGQEGMVGGYWGLFDADRRDKQVLRGAVSDVPDWRRWLALSFAGAGLLLLIAGRRTPATVCCALLGAGCLAWHARTGLLLSRGTFDTLRLLLPAAAALLLLREAGRTGSTRLAAPATTALLALGAMSALELAFDPRYRNFPVAVFAAGTAALALLRARGLRPDAAQAACGALIVLTVPVVVWRESLLNLQALAWVAVASALGFAGAGAGFRPARASDAPVPAAR